MENCQAPKTQMIFFQAKNFPIELPPRDPPHPEMVSALWESLKNGSKPDTPTDYFGYNFLQKEAQQAIPKMIRNRAGN